MKSFVQLFIVCCFFSASAATAQLKPNHFIYIQSETREPFYVMLNGNNYSSSPNGYLILSKLPSGAINFTIGFARDKYPEQNFATTINNTDLGFSLSVNADKQWHLFNLQDFTTIASGQKASNVREKIAEMPTVDTATLQLKYANNAVTNATNQVETTATSVITTNKNALSNTAIVKLSSNVSETGVTEIYLDKGDTVKIFIPNNAKAKADAVTNEPASTNKPDKSVKNCTFASNEDFVKLRAKMASYADERDMLIAGAEAFKEKCFSVEQVKNLSYLLISEQNKLDFLLSAKKTVYDAYNFSTLQALLSKPEIIQQFRNALP